MNSVIVTMELIPKVHQPDAELPSQSVIGRPLPNSSILICSESNYEPKQPGEVGEICIIGPQVARG